MVTKETKIEINNVAVTMQHNQILKDVSLRIASGSCTVILGPNGSGKSTLLRTIAGLLKYQGQIMVDQQELRQISRRVLARQMAFLPQSSETPSDLTVGELVEYGRFPHRHWWKKNHAEDKKAIEWSLQQTRLLDYRERLVKTLSGGERQRAWIAMALAQKPEIMLLDEPTTYLDIAHQLEVLTTVDKLHRAAGLTVVMVLHDINQAVKFADEIIVVKDGAVYAAGKPETVINAQLLRNVFKVEAECLQSVTGRPVFMPEALVDSLSGLQ